MRTEVLKEQSMLPRHVCSHVHQEFVGLDIAVRYSKSNVQCGKHTGLRRGATVELFRRVGYTLYHA
jgi:hypothetical protein